MISTRLHGAVDYAVASLLGAASASPALSAPTRGVLRAAAAAHMGTALATDYEAGVRPVLTMRQHLALDVLGGAGLCAAGLTLRRRRGGERALLVAAGLSELAVAALSSAAPRSGPGQGSGPLGRLLGEAPAGTSATAAVEVGYPPLDVPKPVADDVFVVDSLMPWPLGQRLPVRMAVVRLPDGGLLLHSPTRFTTALRERLERIGPVRHLVAPNVAHWTFLPEWQRQCPGAVTWAAPGLRGRAPVRRSGVRLDHDLGEAAPAEWGGAFALVTVPGGLGFHEVALFHEATRTLLLTDLVLNLEAGKVPAAVRPLVRLFGSLAPDAMPPPYLRAVVRMRRPEAARAAERLVGLAPERVVFAHGQWFERDGTARLRHALRWLLG